MTPGSTTTSDLDMIRLLKRGMEQPVSLGDSDEQEEMLEDDDEDQISKRAAMVRLLRSPSKICFATVIEGVSSTRQPALKTILNFNKN